MTGKNKSGSGTKDAADILAKIKRGQPTPPTPIPSTRAPPKLRVVSSTPEKPLRAHPEYERLSTQARMAVSAALGRINHPHKTDTPRLTALDALEAACAILVDFSPVLAASLCKPLHALSKELEALQDGQAPGKITEPEPVKNRRRAPTKTLNRQARIVIALEALKRSRITRTKGAALLVREGFEKRAKYILDIDDEFKKQNKAGSQRHQQALFDAVDDVWRVCCRGQKRELSELSALDIVKSLRP